MVQYLDPSSPLGALVLAGILFAAGLILSWSVRRLLKTLLIHDRSEAIDQITLSFLSQLSILAIWLLLLTFYAHLVPVLHRLGTALLAGVSLMSVVVGFAAQSTLGNLVAGISLVLYKPFRRGDRLQITAPTPQECEVGVVEDMSLGFTVLRTDDGRKIIVANGTMAQNTMIKLEDGAKQKP
ncbi:mechanosensitive ion channel [Paracoccus sp. M683]|nr:mechanosensitive ion channel [Paracoccus sp. M683]